MTAPLAYLRVSVVNGCRTALRRRSRLGLWPAAVVAALRTLPRRQREAVVLRYYLDLSVEETALWSRPTRTAA